MQCRERAGGLRLTADVHRWQLGGRRVHECRLTAAAADADLLAGPQVQHRLQPVAGVGIAVVVVGRVQAKRLQFGQEPAADHIDGQPPAGDLRDVARDLGEYQRIHQQRLDRPNELDAAGRLGQGGQGRPRLQHIVVGIAGMNDMLRHQG